MKYYIVIIKIVAINVLNFLVDQNQLGGLVLSFKKVITSFLPIMKTVIREN